MTFPSSSFKREREKENTLLVSVALICVYLIADLFSIFSRAFWPFVYHIFREVLIKILHLPFEFSTSLFALSPLFLHLALSFPVLLICCYNGVNHNNWVMPGTVLSTLNTYVL